MTVYSKKSKLWKCSECAYVDHYKNNVKKHILSRHGNGIGAPYGLDAITETVPGADANLPTDAQRLVPFTFQELPEYMYSFYERLIHEKRPGLHPTCYFLAWRMDETLRLISTRSNFVPYVQDVETFEDILIGIFRVTSQKAPADYDFLWRFGASEVYGVITIMHIPKICDVRFVKDYLFGKFFPQMFEGMYTKMKESEDEVLQKVMKSWDRVIGDDSIDTLMENLCRTSFWERLHPLITIVYVDSDEYAGEVVKRVSDMTA